MEVQCGLGLREAKDVDPRGSCHFDNRIFQEAEVQPQSCSPTEDSRISHHWNRASASALMWLASNFSHLVTQLYHAALVGFNFLEVEGEVSTELLEERYSIANQDRQDRIANLIG